MSALANRITRVFALTFLSSALLSGCRGGVDITGLFDAPPGPVSKLTVISGGDQSVRRGENLPAPVVVRLDTAGVPAAGFQLQFVVQGSASPGPNHTWFANTDQNGVASATGVVSNAAVGPATITVKYEVCVRGFKDCEKYEIRASTTVPLTITSAAP